MVWSAIGPNLATGHSGGLEAGLVVSILLAAARRAAAAGRGGAADGSPGVRGHGRRPGRPAGTSTTRVWLGVLAAVTLAASSAAVITHSPELLASPAQEAAGGLLSVLAVGVLTALIFRLRGARAGRTAHIRGEVARPTVIGAWH